MKYFLDFDCLESSLPAPLTTTTTFPIPTETVITVSCPNSLTLVGDSTMTCHNGELITESNAVPWCAEGNILLF